MNLKDILKRYAVSIILGTSIGGFVIANNPIFVNSSDIETSIVKEEEFEDKIEYKLDEREEYYINEEMSKTCNEVLYSSMLIGSTIGLVGVKNKLKKKKMK